MCQCQVDSFSLNDSVTYAPWDYLGVLLALLFEDRSEHRRLYLHVMNSRTRTNNANHILSYHLKHLHLVITEQVQVGS